jgi:hypothetical protein
MRFVGSFGLGHCGFGGTGHIVEMVGVEALGCRGSRKHCDWWAFYI